MKISAHGVSAIGHKRRHNEDAFLCDAAAGIFIVADGMGGRKAGETASKIVVTVLKQMLKKGFAEVLDGTPDKIEQFLAGLMRRLSTELRQRSQAIPQLAGMGSTAVLLFINRDNAFLTYAGDSRAYLFRNDMLKLLSEDQTTAAALVKTGHFTMDAAQRSPLRHALEEYIGKPGQLNPGVLSKPIQTGDRFLLCSDGLTKALNDDRISDILSNHSEPEQLCQHLISEAEKQDGSDNITALVVGIDRE